MDSSGIDWEAYIIDDPLLAMGAGLEGEATAPVSSPRIDKPRLDRGSICGPKAKPAVCFALGPVERELKRILGSSPQQRELLALRKGLFKGILPPASREEKRSKRANLRAFEWNAQRILCALREYGIEHRVRMIAYRERQSESAKQSVQYSHLSAWQAPIKRRNP